MTQEIIALTIVFAAVAYTIYSVIKSVRKKNKSSCDDSCACSSNKKLNKLNTHDS